MNKSIASMALAAFCACAALGEDFAKWVDPFVGTSGDGNCFPGACRPFGMVQPSPDTGDGSRVWCGGYKFEDAKIRGFSQTHLNGTGRPAMGDISILPFVSTGLTGLTGLSGGYPPDSQNPVNLVNPVKKTLEVRIACADFSVKALRGAGCQVPARQTDRSWPPSVSLLCRCSGCEACGRSACGCCVLSEHTPCAMISAPMSSLRSSPNGLMNAT